jgi:hypothetical protein
MNEELGVDQAYVVTNGVDGTIPFTPSTGVTRKGNPLQIVVLIPVIDAFGNTPTFTVNVAPTHEPALRGTTWYVIVCTELELFWTVPVIDDTKADWAWPPLMLEVKVGAIQLYNVPAGTVPFTPLVPTTGLTVNTTPSHVVVVIVEIVGRGFTVTITVNGALLVQPLLNVDKIVYVAVCTVWVLFDRVPDIVATPGAICVNDHVRPPVVVGFPQ